MGVPLVSDLIHCLFFPPSSFFGHCTVLPFLSLLSSWATLQMWPLHSPRLEKILGWLRQVLGGPPKIQAVLGLYVSQQGMCEALICPHLRPEGLSLQEAECSSATGFVMDDKPPGRSRSCPSLSVSVRCSGCSRGADMV